MFGEIQKPIDPGEFLKGQDEPPPSNGTVEQLKKEDSCRIILGQKRQREIAEDFEDIYKKAMERRNAGNTIRVNRFSQKGNALEALDGDEGAEFERLMLRQGSDKLLGMVQAFKLL